MKNTLIQNKKIIFSMSFILLIISVIIFQQGQNNSVENIQISEKVEEVVSQKQEITQKPTIAEKSVKIASNKIIESDVMKIKYTQNYSGENIDNLNYKIRSDGWILHFNEPIDKKNVFSPAFYGSVADEYMITFDRDDYDLDKKVQQVENILGYTILSYDKSGKEGINIKVQLPEYTPEEIYYVKQQLDNIDFIEWFDMNSGILPEYNNKTYEQLIINSMIPERDK